jgi:glycosyltransferase involved in cell wall biosynthesis
MIWIDLTCIYGLAAQPNRSGVPQATAKLVHHLLLAAPDRVRLCIFDPFVGLWRGISPTWFAHNIWTPGHADTIQQALKPAASRLKRVLPSRFYAMIHKAITETARKNRLRRLDPVEVNAGDIILLVEGGITEEQKPQIMSAREKGARIAALIYDLLHIKHPQFFTSAQADTYSKCVSNAIRETDVLFPISANTRRDIVEYCLLERISGPPTHLLRLGDEHRFGTDPAIRPKLLPTHVKDFAVFVSTITFRKNQWLLYFAWRYLAQRSPTAAPYLVLAGSVDPSSNDFLRVVTADPLTKNRIFVLQGLSDSEISWLYEHCEFTLYPSLYEGWGLPVAESLWHGKLCISSSASSLPEVGGDLVKYFDPHNVVELAELVRRYHSSEEDRRACELTIATRFVPYPWAMTAQTLLTQLETLSPRIVLANEA